MVRVPGTWTENPLSAAVPVPDGNNREAMVLDPAVEVELAT